MYFNFQVGSELSFAANGKSYVHLTGYLIEEYPDLEEEEESEDEVNVTVKKKKQTKEGKEEREKVFSDIYQI